MSKEEQHQMRKQMEPEEEKKRAVVTPQGSHKEKAPENLEDPEQQGHGQGMKSPFAKDKDETGNPDYSKTHGMDRNEGQQKPQKT